MNKHYLDILFGNISKELVTNSKLKKMYGLAQRKFDVVSCQFSIHYFFQSLVKLDIFLENVSTSLKKGGHFFIGTSLDGSRVFEQLNTTTDLNVYSKQNELLWQIVKNYSSISLPNDSTSLGMSIDVYVDSIGKTTEEWLINFQYLERKALEYDLKLIDLTSFEEHFNKFIKSKQNYGEAKNLTDDLKKYSFLNTTFVFEKV